MKEIWDRAHLACDSKKVFNGAKVLTLTPEQLDKYCGDAGVVWEQTDEKEIMVHGCGMGCYCHGGRDNKNLRPRD